MPSSTARAASDATTGTETSKTPPKSARRRDLWKCGQRKRVAHSPTGEQKQKKRTFVVLPKPDKLIRYRQPLEILRPQAAWIAPRNLTDKGPRCAIAGMPNAPRRAMEADYAGKIG